MISIKKDPKGRLPSNITCTLAGGYPTMVLDFLIKLSMNTTIDSDSLINN